MLLIVISIKANTLLFSFEKFKLYSFVRILKTSEKFFKKKNLKIK